MDKLRYQYAWKLFCEKRKIQAILLGHRLRGLFNFRPLFLIISFGLVAAVSFILLWRFNFNNNVPFLSFSDVKSAQYWGQLGDFFGGILNPLLSFMALVAVLHSIKIQSQELKEAKEETKIANRIQDRQTAVFERQNFESVFFRLLDVHSRISQQVSLEGDSGQDAFRLVHERMEGFCCDNFQSRLDMLMSNIDHMYAGYGSSETIELTSFQKKVSRAEASKEVIAQATEANIRSGSGSGFSLYFRNMYQLLKLIDGARFDTHGADLDKARRRNLRTIKFEYYQRRQYANMLRAQLSEVELRVLFYNCLSPAGSGLKYYVEKYSLLKHMKKSGFCKDPLVLEFYDSAAYADYEDISDSAIRSFENNKIQLSLRSVYGRAKDN